MSCNKNPKKFLVFKWFGEHAPNIRHINRFGPIAWGKYEVQNVCKLCRVNLGQRIICEEKLVQMGFSALELQTIDSRWGESDIEKLRKV